jgi:hypothetical protein
MGSILIAFGIYQVVLQFLTFNQRALQTPLAIILNIVIFLVWTWLIVRYFSRYSLHKTGEYYLVYFAAGIWNPIIFVPLHYITQGYLTSFGNIIVLWMYQVVVNLPVLFSARWLSNRMRNYSA